MDWLSLSLLSALFLAAADAYTKKWLSQHSAVELVVVRFVLSGVLFIPLFLLLYRPTPVPPVFWLWVAAALPLEILAMRLYMLAIRDAPLALTLPYLAFTPVFVVASGWVLLGETVSLQGLAGILMVTAGAYVLNLEHANADWRSWLDPLLAVVRERGSRMMLAVAMIYGVASVFGKGALQYMPASTFGPLYFMILGAFTLAFYAAWQPGALRVLRHTTRYHWLIGLFMALTVFTHFLALEQIQTAYMIAAKRTSSLFGILLGAWLFREARLGQHLVGAALMVAGVGIIAWHTLP